MGTRYRFGLCLAFLLGFAWVPGISNAGLFGKDDPDKKREELQAARVNGLSKLYAQEPQAEAQVKAAKGYAVFSTFGMNLLLVSTQRGGGILHDNRSNEDIYMRMFSAGGGLGLGVKEFVAVFIFHTEAALDQFLRDGWDFSAQAEAKVRVDGTEAGAETSGTAVPGTTLHQVTEQGVAAQVTLQGTKFWADEALNQ